MRLAVIGVGKLGACVTAWLASRGHEVFAVETSPRRLHALQREEFDPEPHLYETWKKHAKRIHLCKIFHDGAGIQAAFVVVPTPSQADGTFDEAAVLKALRDIPDTIPVIIMSTLTPGTMDRIHRPHSWVAYHPLFIALGRVMMDLNRPPYHLVGTKDIQARMWFLAFYSGTCQFMTPLQAEITKLVTNVALIQKITLANLTGMLCARLRVSDQAVLYAVGSDPRIGREYLRAGAPYGGPCFPRDINCFDEVLKLSHIRGELPSALEDMNGEVSDFLIARILTSLKARRITRVTLIGMGYKSGVSWRHASFGVVLAQALGRSKIHLTSMKRAQALIAVQPGSVLLVKKNQILIDVWSDMGAVQ